MFNALCAVLMRIVLLTFSAVTYLVIGVALLFQAGQLPAAGPPAVPQAVAAVAVVRAPSQTRQAPTWSAGADEQTLAPVIPVKTLEPEPPQDAVGAAVPAPTIETSQTDFYQVGEEASDDRTAVETTSGPPPVVVAARAEQPVDQASSDQPAPAPKSTKQTNPKTTAKKPVLRDSANKEQHHAKAVAVPDTEDQTIGSNQEPATGDVQEDAFHNPISTLRELSESSNLHGRGRSQGPEAALGRLVEAPQVSPLNR